MTKEVNHSEANGTPPAQQFMIQRIYLKDASLECPNTPEIFKSEWKPEVNVELTNNAQSIAENTFEVQLTVTVTVRLGEKKVAYLVEIKQCGIFLIAGFDDDSLDNLLGSYCPSILFPFVRESIADIIQRAGFPAFFLQPVNFDAIYAQQKQQKQKLQSSEPAPTRH